MPGIRFRTVARRLILLCGAGCAGARRLRDLQACGSWISDGKTVVPARVNVIASDDAFYKPEAPADPLENYSFRCAGNRSNVGPMRYEGSSERRLHWEDRSSIQSGYGEEILADVVLGKSHRVELLQVASYRPKIGLAGCYWLLNSGFRYAMASGNYPVCRTFADSRTYLAESRGADFRPTIGRSIRGECLASSITAAVLRQTGKGRVRISRSAARLRALDVRLLAVSADLPFNDLKSCRTEIRWSGGRMPRPSIGKN